MQRVQTAAVELLDNGQTSVKQDMWLLTATSCWPCMAQAVSRRPLIAEARIRTRASQCGISGGQSGSGIGFFPDYFGLPVNFIPPVPHYKEKRKRKTNHLHHRVASAAGPFTTQKRTLTGISFSEDQLSPCSRPTSYQTTDCRNLTRHSEPLHLLVLCY